MFLKLSIIFLVIALLLLFVYIAKRKHKSFVRKASGFLSVVLLLCSAVLIIIHIKSNNIKIFNRVKSYDITTEYTESLSKNGEELAYTLLPYRIYAQDKNIYFINSENDLFLMSENEGVYSFATEANQTVYAGGGKTLKVIITEEGDLSLSGNFLYSKYEGDLLTYDNYTIAENVESCNATSNSLFYITRDRQLYAMGFNEYAQLGDTTTKAKNTPVFIADNIKTADISDTHSMIVDKYGTLYAVGDNSYSQLGNKTAVSSNELTRIMQGVKDVCVGNYFSLVLTVNGELYTAGTNTKGQLGNDGGEFKAELIHIMSGVEKICVNKDTCAALTYNGELYVWGDNTNFKAGVKEGDILDSPVKIHDNVYDFALSETGAAVLTKDRDIIISNENGEFVTALEMNATVPDAHRERTVVTSDETPVTA